MPLNATSMKLVLAALPLILAACGNTPSAAAPEVVPTPPASSATRCNAAPAQFALGRNADAALTDEASMKSGARIVRVLQPNQVVTMEFSAERLNLTVDATGRVTRVSCG